MTLTRRQKELLDFIREFVDRNGYAPTFEEIAKKFQLSSLATVHKHLTHLEQKGKIRRHDHLSRAIEVIDETPPAAAVEIPLLGRVAAGAPIEAVETDRSISVPRDLVNRRPSFALEVVGNSMIEDGILDGDQIVVARRESADNGDTVVAVIDGNATVKRFYREKNGSIRLQPANSRMKPIVVAGGDLAIRGVVTGVVRRYAS